MDEEEHINISRRQDEAEAVEEVLAQERGPEPGRRDEEEDLEDGDFSFIVVEADHDGEDGHEQEEMLDELLRAPIPLHGVAVTMGDEEDKDEEEGEEEEEDHASKEGEGGGVLTAAIKALKERAAVGKLLPNLVAAREELAAFLFQCPPPRKDTKPPKMKEEVRVRAMTWLFVLDYVTQDVIPKDGLEKVPEEPMELVQRIGEMAPHRICQHAFRKNDIVWICKNCQKDETCVLCNSCFIHERHVGHEVYFYHTQAGGCCDCGDEDAWDRRGFCDRHGNEERDPLSPLSPSIIQGGRWVLQKCVDYLLQATERVVHCFDLTAWEEVAHAGETAALGSSSPMAPGAPAPTPTEMYRLVLHQDDIHRVSDVASRLSTTLRIPEEQARLMAKEVMQKGLAPIRRGPLSAMIEAARALRDEGGLVMVSIMPQGMTKTMDLALVQLQWLYRLAGVAGGICRLVVEQLSTTTLSQLMRAHSHLPRHLVSSLHTLYLFLMADQTFKCAVASAYAITYLEVTRLFAAGLGVAEYSLYTLSVQFLNRSFFVNELVSKHDFLRVLCRALREMLEEAAMAGRNSSSSTTSHLDEERHESVSVNHLILQHRRYSNVIADIKFVLNIEGVAQEFLRQCLADWLAVLGLVQYLHRQRRELAAHVAYETREWMYAFNVQISLSSVTDHMLQWARTAAGKDAVELATQILHKIQHWTDRLLFVEHASSDGGVESITIEPLSLTPGLGEIRILTLPPDRSFHLILHRFFASLLREMARNPAMVQSIGDLVARCQGSGLLGPGLIKLPLSVVVMASEIRVGMWRRNGQVMFDQMVNYAEPPFCKMFRDMDLLLLQFAGLIQGAETLLHHQLYSFSVLDWFRMYPHNPRVEPQLRLAEEFLLVLIHTITELPLPPLPFDDRLRLMLRREVVHKLASGPCTHSELQDCCHQFADQVEAVPESLLDEILSEVATRKEGTYMEPEKFVIRPSAWDEYDPAFFHMTVQAHHQASEHRPLPKEPKPLVPGLLPAHPTFLPLRRGLLASPTVHRILYIILKHLVNGSTSQLIANNLWSDLLLFRAIHILTLAVHAAKEDPGSETATRFFRLLETDMDPVSSGEGESRLLDVLLRLPEACKSDGHMLQAVKWLIRTLEEVDEGCAGVIRAVREGSVPTSAAEKEGRKKRAMERAMRQIGKSAAQFMMDTDVALGDDDDDDVHMNVQSGQKPAVKSKPQEEAAPECIVCRGDTGELVGYAAFCQRSNLLSRRRGGEGRLLLPPAEHSWGVALSLCGHALHYSCWERYYAGVVEQSELIEDAILCTRQAEYQCPLCKTVSNALVPFISQEALHPKETTSSQGADMMSPSPGATPSMDTVVQDLVAGNDATTPEVSSLSNLKTACARFLCDVEHLPGSHHMALPTLTVPAFVATCKSVAFTLSMAVAERGHGVALGGEAEEAADVAHFQRLKYVTRVLQYTAKQESMLVSLKKIMHRRFSSSPWTTSTPSDLPESEAGVEGEVGPPLLAHNLLTTLVMAAVMPSEEPREALMPQVRDLYLARVLQQLWGSGSSLRTEVEGPGTLGCLASKLATLLLNTTITKRESPSCLTGRDGDREAAMDDADDEKFHRHLEEDVAGAAGAFLRAALLVLVTVPGGDTMFGDMPLPPHDATLETLQAFFEVPTLPQLAEGRGSPFDPKIRAWLEQFSQWFKGSRGEEEVSCRCQCDFPVWSVAEFIPLVSSYTELHSSLATRSDSEHPALCLMCGANLNADGSGECTRHAKDCGLGTGVFFLLQDCTVLLIYGDRACYFPGPYVDAYGERHKQFRGRPLFLDHRRLEALRKLWAKQRVAMEVVHSRSTSKQVIYNGYY